MADNTSGDRTTFYLEEYKALAEYYGKVITFRFNTTAFFIAAVALILAIGDPKLQHYVLLVALTVGIWIVELRNRSIYDNLLSRARRIESAWIAYRDTDDLPFFTHMVPDPYDTQIPKEAFQFDRTRILAFDPFRSRYIRHTTGLDIVYLSVLIYAVYGVFMKADIAVFRETAASLMDPVAVLVALSLLLAAINLIRFAAGGTNVKWPGLVLGIGVVLLLAATGVIAVALQRAA